MFCIGLTGNIGSGKSSALGLFQSFGVFVISADKIARALTAKGEKAFVLIKDHFGKEIVDTQGELNRPLLRTIIFEHKEERLWLEGLLHPLIREEIKAEINKSEAPYCMIEIPLLTARKDYPYLDRILVIQAALDAQIQRIMQRDHCNAEAALKIIDAQASKADLEGLADDVLQNDGSIAQLRQKIAVMHERYLEMAKAKSKL